MAGCASGVDVGLCRAAAWGCCSRQVFQLCTRTHQGRGAEAVLVFEASRETMLYFMFYDSNLPVASEISRDSEGVQGTKHRPSSYLMMRMLCMWREVFLPGLGSSCTFIVVLLVHKSVYQFLGHVPTTMLVQCTFQRFKNTWFFKKPGVGRIFLIVYGLPRSTRLFKTPHFVVGSQPLLFTSQGATRMEVVACLLPSELGRQAVSGGGSLRDQISFCTARCVGYLWTIPLSGRRPHVAPCARPCTSSSSLF